ncbi:MAG: PH domain-containing protein [Pirellulales bacterium]
MRCRFCGGEVGETATFCPTCGERLSETPAPQPVASPPADEEASPVNRVRRRNTADDPEAEIWQGSYSPKAMYGEWVAGGVATVGAIVLAVLLVPTGVGTAIVFGLVVLMWLFLAARLLYLKYSVNYRLTSQRFVHQSGLLSRVTDRIEVIDMDDISFAQGPIQRMLGVGTIRITSSDRTHPELVLRGIENVADVSGLIDNARRKERVRRGLHIEAV